MLSTHKKWLPHVNNTHKKCIEIEPIYNLANKTIANHKIMVYACMRYLAYSARPEHLVPRC